MLLAMVHEVKGMLHEWYGADVRLKHEGFARLADAALCIPDIARLQRGCVKDMPWLLWFDSFGRPQCVAA